MSIYMWKTSKCVYQGLGRMFADKHRREHTQMLRGIHTQTHMLSKTKVNVAYTEMQGLSVESNVVYCKNSFDIL